MYQDMSMSSGSQDMFLKEITQNKPYITQSRKSVYVKCSRLGEIHSVRIIVVFPRTSVGYQEYHCIAAVVRVDY